MTRKVIGSQSLTELLDTLESGGRPKGGVGNIREGVPSIGGEHITRSGRFNFSEIRFVPQSYYDHMKKGRIRKDDILLVKDGATTGKVALVDDSFPYLIAAVNEHVFIVRARKGRILPRYLFFFLHSSIGQAQVLANFHGAAQGGINSSFADNVVVPTPAIDVQEKIATVLEKSFNLALKREEANHMTHKIVRSVFLKMFGDPAINSTGWPVVRLETVCKKITDGTHITPGYLPRGVPFVSVKDVTHGHLDLSNTKFISPEEHSQLTKRYRPEFGDVLYTKVGVNFGRAVLIDVRKEFSIFVSVALIKPKHEVIDSRFLVSMLNSEYVKSQANRRIKGIGVPDLHLEEIRAFDIVLPPLDLQQRFAEFTQRLESVRQSQLKSTEELNGVFNSIENKAFRGELAIAETPPPALD